MRFVKAAAGLTCGTIMLLLFLTFTSKNPDQNRYEETVNTLMNQTGIDHEEEIKKQFPELEQIQTDMKQIAYLNQIIEGKIKSPAPIIDEPGKQRLESQLKQREQLQVKVESELLKLLAAHEASQP